MKLNAIWLLFSICTFPSFSVFSQVDQSVLNGFLEIVPPKVGDEDWYRLNESSLDYAVSIKNDSLVIRETEYKDTCTLIVSGGTYFGVDHGEWGGKLFFLSSNNPPNLVAIKRGNVKFIFRFDGQVYFIEGLAHMGMSDGAIFKLQRNDERFEFSKVLEFDDAPEAYAIQKDSILIATTGRFYVVRNFQKELLFEKHFGAASIQTQ